MPTLGMPFTYSKKKFPEKKRGRDIIPNENYQV